MLSDLIRGAKHLRITLVVGGAILLSIWLTAGEFLATREQPPGTTPSGRLLIALDELGPVAKSSSALLFASLVGTAVWRVVGFSLTERLTRRLAPLDVGPHNRWLVRYEEFYERYGREPSLREQSRDLGGLDEHLGRDADEHVDLLRRLEDETEFRITLSWLGLLLCVVFAVGRLPWWFLASAAASSAFYLDAKSTARQGAKTLSETGRLYEAGIGRRTIAERSEVRDIALQFPELFPEGLESYDVMPQGLRSLLAEAHQHIRAAVRTPDPYDAQQLYELLQLTRDLARRSLGESYGGSEVYQLAERDIAVLLDSFPTLEN